MSTTTYDPILEVHKVRRFRILTPLSSPAMGTALVLEPVAGPPMVVSAGDRVPDARLGAYRRSFLVDLGQYTLRLEELLPGRDPSFEFPCAVTFSCRVLDPVTVASLNIRDMTAALRLSLVRIMRRVTRDYDISELNAAEPALNDALERFAGDRAIQLSGFLVEFAARDDYHRTVHDLRMDGIRRKAMEGIVAGGQDGIYAQWLAKHDGDPDELLRRDAEAKALESQHLLEAMRIVSSSGEKTEAFEVKAERSRLIGRLVSDSDGGGPERGVTGSRRSRISGSLASGSTGSRPEDAGGGRDGHPADRSERPYDRGDAPFADRRTTGPGGRLRDANADPAAPRAGRGPYDTGTGTADGFTGRGPRDAATGDDHAGRDGRGPHEAGARGRTSRVRGTGARPNGVGPPADPDAGSDR